MLNNFSDTINYNLFIIFLNVCFFIFITISIIYCLFYLIQNLNEMSNKNICVIIVLSLSLVIIGYYVLNIVIRDFSMISGTISKMSGYLDTYMFDPVGYVEAMEQ